MKRRALTPEHYMRSHKFAIQLRRIRKSKGKTAKFVSDHMKVAPSYLSDLETGRRCFTPALVKLYRAALAK